MIIVCKRCFVPKPLDAFHKDKTRATGHFPYCRVCSNKQSREYTASIKHTEAYKFRRRRNQAKYVERYPERQKAHEIAQYRRSELVKDACEDCGAKKPRLHLHHPDYSEPLTVITLCVSCHEKAHHGVIA